MSRSATIVISYIMNKFPEMTLAKALRFVKTKRPIVNPNDGFLKQLTIYEKVLEKQRYQEKLSTKLPVNIEEGKVEESNNQAYTNLEQGSVREDVRTRHTQSRNYHYTRGMSSYNNNRKPLNNDHYSDESHNHGLYEYKKKQFNAKLAPRVNVNKSFLEQHLTMHRPSILQK